MKKLVLLLGCVAFSHMAFASEDFRREMKEKGVWRTPAGEACVKEADNKELVNKEWRSFMATCLKEKSGDKPHKAEVKKCLAKADSKSNDPQRHELKECLQRVKDEAEKKDAKVSKQEK